MSGYGRFARYYDSLTDDVRYRERAAFFDVLIKRHMPKAELLLDLACGTGSLTGELSALGYDLIGVDASEDMLSVAMQKAGDFTGSVMFLCQEAQHLDLYGTVDVCVCALDSLNHLPGVKSLDAAMARVSLFMNPGGLFLFDLNTLYKHREILADNTFVYEREDVCCVWRNEYSGEDDSVDITLDFFEKTGANTYTRYTESFSEYYFNDKLIESLLDHNGLGLLETYDGDTFGAPSPLSQRTLYATQKK
ncbi:MAG: class I SAM-dependent methyltransferase [Oscillospiraceae bacterium]|jgi:SAM-dependent methyltransferase|nr:class I SAM-dependent methyltransferase [Oscillospiraceae bacterium]